MIFPKAGKNQSQKKKQHTHISPKKEGSLHNGGRSDTKERKLENLLTVFLGRRGVIEGWKTRGGSGDFLWFGTNISKSSC